METVFTITLISAIILCNSIKVVENFYFFKFYKENKDLFTSENSLKVD